MCTRSRFLLLSLFLPILIPSSVDGADSFSVREFVGLKDKWPDFAKKKSEITLNGRFAGRIARQFRFGQFPMMIAPARSTSLPSDVDPEERVTITGTITKSGSRFTFEAQRIAISSTDGARLRKQIQRLPDGKFDEAYQLADSFQGISDFYDDQSLKNQIQNLRLKTFQLQRKAAAADHNKLISLVKTASDLGLDEDIQQHVRFESINRMVQQNDVSPADTLKRIRTELTGWDDFKLSIPDAQQRAFLKDPIATYEARTAEERPAFHRLIYRTVQLSELEKSVAKDGSNANEIADQISKELPEEKEAVRRLTEQYVDYRLAAVPRLSRRQLSELEELLISLERRPEFLRQLEIWLTAQEKRLNNQQLDGLLETADQYLFAFERWKIGKHGEAGVRYLKRCWNLASGSAPKEAAKLATRLEQLGWVRLRDEWLTKEAVDALPDSDQDLAMKEGRVIKGMKTAQVLLILGEPGRKIRVASKSDVQEIWVFGGNDSTGITVHLTRRSFDQTSAATVTKVARSGR